MESMAASLEGVFNPPALACAACREAHIACSKERPCKRCAVLGKACFDPEKKKRGRPKKSELRRQQQQQQQEQDHFHQLPPSKKARPNDLPLLFPTTAGGGGISATSVSAQAFRHQLLGHGNGNGHQTPASSSSPSSGPIVDGDARFKRGMESSSYSAATNGRHVDGGHAKRLSDSASPPDSYDRRHQPARSAQQGINGELSGNLLCLLVDQMKDLKRDVRETKRRQDGIEDLLRELKSKIDLIPSLVANAVVSALPPSSSSSQTPQSSASTPTPLDGSSSPISPSMPVIRSNSAPQYGYRQSTGDFAAFGMLPGFPGVTPQQIASLFPFLDEYNLAFTDRPFVCDSIGKPVVVLRCMPHDMLGEENTPPLIIYVNDALCSMVGYTRDELVGCPITKLAMPDYVFKDEVSKRFLAPPGTMIGDIFTHAMLVMKKNGMPARAHNRFQFFYNTKRRQRWLFSVSDFTEEDNISFNPITIVHPSAWHRSNLMLEQRAQELERESEQALNHSGQALPHGAEQSPLCGQPQQQQQQGDFIIPGVETVIIDGRAYAEHPYTYPPAHPMAQRPAHSPSGAAAERERAPEYDDSIRELLASMGGPSPAPSPLPFPTSPFSSNFSFY